MSTAPIAAFHIRAAAEREVLSARPGAPVVVEQPAPARRPRLERSRTGLASVLHRTADRVAPACGAPC
ncbi:hypothetical protein [Oryzihumus sp.]|uniref:hypothetical protein n=1 Tax=Oryzihumus sp. TaxID=1968903 RepID=UPI002EDB04C6